MNVRREICPNCSRPLMKSRRLKFQMGQWRCAHCGAIWTGTLDLDEGLGEESNEGETLPDASEQVSESDESANADSEDEQPQSTENTPK